MSKNTDLRIVIKIGDKYIGDGHPAFFIAEIGNNHNGDFYLAKKSIEEAAKAGADAVKFQKRCIDEVFTKEMQDVPQTKDIIYGKTYGEYRENLELERDDFEKLKKIAEDLGLIFFATPFDRKSVDFLEDLSLPLYKIASFDVTSIPILEYVASKQKPVILSLGMATEEEVDMAISAILKINRRLAIMHCVSIYPTPDEHLNLRTIPYLKEKYPHLPVGYSGHEEGILPSVSSITLGANLVERHLTIDKNLPGPDHGTVSIEPHEFEQMVKETRRIEKMLGKMGKFLAKGEEKVRRKHSKSIVSKENIKAGSIIGADQVTIKCPGTGFKAYEIDKVVGSKVGKDIPKDTVITKEYIL